MGRSQRIACEGNVYHVTARGVAQQSIFEDDDDRRFMAKLLAETVDSLGVKILAWCFMSNHIHLLIHGSLDKVSSFMSSVLSRYARRYNERHARVGHLFQGRFYSSAIDSDEYLLTAVRYIHFNPNTMGLVRLDHYQWSSYREYLGSKGFSDTDFVLSVFGGLESFKDFHAQPNDDQDKLQKAFEGSGTRGNPSDDELIAAAKDLLGIDNLSFIGQASKEERNRMLVVLKSRFTVRQIARITGLGRNIIQRAR